MDFLWAKCDGAGSRLPLIDHMLDVAGCMRALCQSPGYARAFRHAAGRDLTEQDLQRICVFSALHDIGKANPDFLRGLGGHLEHGQAIIGSPDFGLIWDLRPWCDDEVLLQAICASISHHGKPIWPDCIPMRELAQKLYASQGIPDAVSEVIQQLKRSYPLAFAPGPPLPDRPEFWHLFTGLLTMADQVGSSTRYFPIHRSSEFTRDPGKALRDTALDASGMFPPTSLDIPEVFGWPAGSAPTPLQRLMAELPVSDRLILAESETGSGKTEAALIRFRRLAEAGEVSGMYFALPTRSSAVQIQRRVNEATMRLWGREAALAVPGYLVFGDDEGERDGPFDVVWGENGRREPGRWAIEAPRKFLAAPVAVGTIDQALFATLRCKWAHMRGAALSRSLLVVDEVHASDFYMSELLIRLVRSHIGLGGHVLLMSATLSSRRRHEIFEACGARPSDPGAIGYPAVTSLRNDAQAHEILPAPARNKSVAVCLSPTMTDAAAVARQCAAAWAAGGRVLVIRNSVRGAMAVHEALRINHPEVRLLVVNGRPTLHHARFSAQDRKALDAAVEAQMGKGSSEPVVVIGTQTLEQSLDIDADLMITDVCPIDVLLQRIGRLHRHFRSVRPIPFRDPKCIVLHDPEADDRLLRSWGQIGKDRAYPDRMVVEETIRMIREIPQWQIPVMNRMLVDRGARDDLAEMEEGAEREGRSAAMRRLARSAALDRSLPIHDEDNLRFGPEHRSRLGEPGLLVRLENRPASPIGTGPVCEIQIPSWMIGNWHPEGRDTPAVVCAPCGEGFRFCLEDMAFEYHASGLTQIMRKNDRL